MKKAASVVDAAGENQVSFVRSMGFRAASSTKPSATASASPIPTSAIVSATGRLEDRAMTRPTITALATTGQAAASSGLVRKQYVPMAARSVAMSQR